MKAHVLISVVAGLTLVSFTQSAIQYKEYKVRGPPMHPPRITRNPQHYTKTKWPIQHQQRIPARQSHIRPIPIHMASYKVPVIARPPKTPTPFIFPSAVWKTPTAVYKPPVEMKPFLTSPPVSQQFEFHVNKEPILTIPTIKQIGEKGPIHTIPAPNLSPADKPKVILEEHAQKHTYQYTKEPELSPNSLLGPQALPLVSAQSHQYQVTENSEPGEQLIPQNAFTSQKNYYAPEPDSNNLIQKLTQYTDTNALANNLKVFQPDMFISPHQFVSNAANIPLSSQDLYQLLNGVPQQQLVDSYGMPLIQQPQLQQHFIQQASQAVPQQNIQSFLSQPQYLQTDHSAYYNQIQPETNQHIKDNFNPQYQTFNYEEPAPKSSKDYAQSRVTADYSVEPVAIDTSPITSQIAHSSQQTNDALAQSQYIQQYFTTHDNNNDLESNQHEGSNRAAQILSQLSAKNEISPTLFYSTLPNKEAADRLATLQAAGGINSVLKLNKKQEQSSNNNNNQMRIYVPDDEESYEDLETQSSGEHNKGPSQEIRIYETTHLNKQNAESRHGESSEYEDYSGEEDASKQASSEETSPNFGNKLNSKSSSSR